MITIDIKTIYGDTARLSSLDDYILAAKELAGEGNNVTITGPGPVWLYLVLAHALHGTCRKLTYTSPVTGEVLIFDHSC